MTATDLKPRARHRRSSPMMLAVLDSALGRLFPGLCELRYVGARTGRVIRLPVSCAAAAGRLVVSVGDAERKTWWRNFLVPRRVDAVIRGAVHPGVGRLVATGHEEWTGAQAVYARRYPHRDIGTAPFIVIELDDGPAKRSAEQALRSAWFRWVTAGETAGFVIPAATAAAIGDSAASVAVPALIAAGVMEGSLLGAAQGHVLRRALPRLPSARWVAVTAVAAGIAWLLGLLPSLVADGRPRGVVVAFGVVAGCLLLATIGSAQAWVLRGHIGRPARWISGTALGWSAGLAVFFGFATPLWRPGQPGWLIGVIGACGGLLMAATVAAVTGRVLVRLLRD